VILYVLRHAIAEEAGPDGDDAARQLTSRGRARMRRAALGIQRLKLGVDVLLTSPLVRARQTAELVAPVFDGLQPRELDALAAGVDPADTVRALRPFVRHHGVMIVGHEPGLSGVVSLLLTGSSDTLRLTLKKGGLVALEMDALPPRGTATLHWILTPRQLRAMRSE
jgi:phosphohistidine phosphatase